jgi:hypothetical protein
MPLFENYPAITYTFTSRTDATPIIETIQDLSTKIQMVISAADLENLCSRYLVKTGELPQHISFNTYGTTDYDWTVLYINGIGNLNAEWPLSDLELIKFVSAKYGASHIYDTHHYEKLPEGLEMDFNFITSQYGAQYVSPVTNMDYETIMNEQKRMIYVIKPENISDFISQFKANLA